MMKKNEIPDLPELQPEEVKIDSRAYREALYDPTGPRTREYALKVARESFIEAQKRLSEQATSQKRS